MLVFILFWHFVQVGTHVEVDVDGPLAGIDTALQDARCCYLPRIQSFLMY